MLVLMSGCKLQIVLMGLKANLQHATTPHPSDIRSHDHV